MNSKDVIAIAALTSILMIPSWNAHSRPAEPPLGYLAIGFEYHSGKLTGAQILGQSPSLQGCLKAAQEVVAAYLGHNKDPKASVNAGCMPIPMPTEVL